MTNLRIITVYWSHIIRNVSVIVLKHSLLLNAAFTEMIDIEIMSIYEVLVHSVHADTLL